MLVLPVCCSCMLQFLVRYINVRKGPCRESRESSIGMGERVVNFLPGSYVVNDGGLRIRPQELGRFPPRTLEILLVALFAIGGYPQAKSETQLRSQASRLAALHAEARCDFTTTACGLPRPGRGALSEATLPSDTFPLRRVGSRASSDGGDAGPIRVLNRLAPCSKWEEELPGGASLTQEVTHDMAASAGAPPPQVRCVDPDYNSTVPLEERLLACIITTPLSIPTARGGSVRIQQYFERVWLGVVSRCDSYSYSV